MYQRTALRRLISFISNELCCCFAKDQQCTSVQHFKPVWECHCIYIFDFVIVFVNNPNNLELILRHPASPLNNNVPRKSRVALLSSIWRRIPNRARSYFLEYIILTCANKITTHFSYSCRNEGQRLDAFQVYYLCDALDCNKAMSENNNFLNIKLNYYSFKIFPLFWLAKSTRIIHHNQPEYWWPNLEELCV